ncbi:MAG: carbon storage regulator CsrA [Desulfobacter sp.]|nr:MAG: carbon storage regulator CsrA [Desulfobacter sp.]
MLVLSRKVKEQIKIGDNIVVSVLGIEGNSVKIGIEAPGKISILRMEVFEQIQKENIGSAAGAPEDISQAAALVKKRFIKEQKD